MNAKLLLDKANKELDALFNGASLDPVKSANIAYEALEVCQNNVMSDNRIALLLGTACVLCGATLEGVVNNAETDGSQDAMLAARGIAAYITRPVLDIAEFLDGRLMPEQIGKLLHSVLDRIARTANRMQRSG